jgi:acyl phosphate:glycerol-3-phosphate acyltransferase
MPEVLASLVLGYLLGSLPSGLIAGYIWLQKDIRNFGSGSTGTTNVLRTAGKAAAAFVFVADVAKGVIPALVGLLLFDEPWAAAAGAGAAVVGHIWPVFAGFRGGRGVATAFGGILGLSPLLALAFPLIALVLFIPTRIVSVMSVGGAFLAGAVVVSAWALGATEAAYAAYAVLVVALIEYKHIPNLKRLLAGTEPRIGQGGDRPAPR